MSLVGKAGASLLAFVATVTLYLILRGIQNVREIALQAEEHRLLLELPSATSDVAGNVRCNLDLWRQYEDARWLLRTQHLLAFGAPMRFLMYGTFGKPQPISQHIVTRHSTFLLSQVQNDLRRCIPTELERVANISDQQAAAREVVRLLTMGFFAKLFETWEQGEQVYQQALADPQSRGQLTQLFRLVDSAKPRLRGDALLGWVTSDEKRNTHPTPSDAER